MSKIERPGRTPLYLAGLLVLVFVLHSDVLFTSQALVPCDPTGDAVRFYGPLREFASSELGKGNVALWNPYLYSGTPCLAACQPAVFYPFNAHYLVLPLAKAITFEVVLHLYLVGVFAFFWARHWKLPRYAAALTATVAMFSAPVYLQSFIGHLSISSALPWAVLAFWAADALIDTRRWVHVCTGAFAFSLCLLAGHPQVAFNAYVMLAIYITLRLALNPLRLRYIVPFGLFFSGPLLLIAAMMWPAMAVSGETVRAGGLSYDSSTSVSFPPENILTYFAPSVFGDGLHSGYWGRWLFWEVCAFSGVTALTLAAYGVVTSRVPARFIWCAVIVVVIILSLGHFTPLYVWVWKFAPGFDLFRVPSRFLWVGSVFIALLAGFGAKELVERGTRSRIVIVGAALAAVGLAVAAVGARFAQPLLWLKLVNRLQPNWRLLLNADDTFLIGAAMFTVYSLALAGAICALLGVIFVLAPKYRQLRLAIVIVGMLELFAFAWFMRSTENAAEIRSNYGELLSSAPENSYRMCDRHVSNVSMLFRERNIWGYDSAALDRYVAMMAATQNVDAEVVLNEFDIRKAHPYLAALSCGYLVDSSKVNPRRSRALKGPLPRFSFPASFHVVPDLKERLAIIGDRAFNPRETVLLETEPIPAPSEFPANGEVNVLDETTDVLTLEITVDQDTTMLMADAYAKAWTVVPIEPGPQSTYTILPANHALRAIPLVAGRHVIRMEYAPWEYPVGMGVSIVSCLCFFPTWAMLWRRTRRDNVSSPDANTGVLPIT